MGNRNKEFYRELAETKDRLLNPGADGQVSEDFEERLANRITKSDAIREQNADMTAIAAAAREQLAGTPWTSCRLSTSNKHSGEIEINGGPGSGGKEFVSRFAIKDMTFEVAVEYVVTRARRNREAIEAAVAARGN